MAIEIRNMRGKNWPTQPWQVKVDRSSVLGNPPEHGKERELACVYYTNWFKHQLANEAPHFMEELRRLYRLHQQYGKLELFCWCAPKRCHAETIKAFLDKHI